MWRSVVRWCSRADLDGAPSRYYPRVRPRRLVMPVDPNDVHSAKRQGNALFERYKAQLRLTRQVQRRGALRLASVPVERSVADAFRVMLTTCERSGFFAHDRSNDDDAAGGAGDGDGSESDASMTPTHMQALERAVHALTTALRSVDAARNDKVNNNDDNNKANDDDDDDGNNAAWSPMYALALDKARDVSTTATSTAAAAGELTVRDIDRIWDMLERTPLNAPVHGPLAQRGKALVEYTIAHMSYDAFPRLRSRHVQQLLHQTCGLLPCGEAAARLGLVDVTGVEGELSMWRELNVLTERLREAHVQASSHKQRVEKGMTQQRRWYWRAVFRSARSRLRTFPVHASELQPRMEWLRSQLFAFVAFVHVSSSSHGGDGDGTTRAQALVRRVFCPALARFRRERAVLARAAAALDDAAAALQAASRDNNNDNNNDDKDAVWRRVAQLRDIVAAERTRALTRSANDVDVLDEHTHPLNHVAALRRAQFSSSGGMHAIEPLRDDVFSDTHVTRHRRQAPAVVLHALYTPHALKEAQLILRYAPHVSPSLRRAPLDVDQVVRRVTEVHETNRYARLRYAQQFRAVDYTVCRLYAGTRCLGEGKGETLMQSMQEAAQHMTYNYYLQPPHTSHASHASPHRDEAASVDARDSKTSSANASGDGDDDSDDDNGMAVSAVRMRASRTEEEVVF